MSTNKFIRSLVLAIPLLLAACASPPPAAPAASGAAAPAADARPVPAGQTRYKWSKASEAEVAAQLDQKFQEAAKSFVQVKRNDQLMFCKKYREMGSSIRTLHCITEAELRKQVEDSEELRAQMRNKVGRCTGGQPVACGAGQ
jgi:starvation-inducible outer membrane lipoprotein